MHSTVGKSGKIDIMVLDTDDCQRLVNVESLCVGVTLSGSARIQYERGGTIKQCIMDLDVATTMFDTCIEVNDEGPRVGIQLYCPLLFYSYVI